MANETKTVAASDETKPWWHGCAYFIKEVPAEVVKRTAENHGDQNILKWSGAEIPKIGDRVEVNFNGFGFGVVDSYFWEHGFFGVRVKLEIDPDWHVKQSAGSAHAGHVLVFGSELAPFAVEAPAATPAKTYTENETAVLKAAYASMKGNGFDFGFIDDCRVEGKTAKQCGATMRVLRKKLPAFAVDAEFNQLYIPDWKGPQPSGGATFEEWLAAVEHASA